MFAGLKQNHKVTRERISESALNFVIEKISDFKLSTKLSATMIYHYQMDIIEQATTKNCPEFLFNENILA